MNAFELAVTVWFVSAVISHIAGTLALGLWLDRQHVKLGILMRGFPGYVERAYRSWCVNHGRSPRTVLVLRSISLINTILAVLFFILISRRLDGTN